MKISDRLSAGFPVFSFEFYPPKTEKGDANLWKAIGELKSLQPSFVSVTYGAGGSTNIKTRGLTSRIKQELGIEAMAHLTCVGSNRAEIKVIIGDLVDAGIENILCLRGDPPQGQQSFISTEGGFNYGNELVAYAKELGVPCIGAACYPEGHVDSPTLREDIHHLKTKVDAGADFLISQLFFDNRHYFDFVDRARAAGITVPIIPGIMPIGSYEQIHRFTKMCGASLPDKLVEELEQRKEEPQSIHELGVAYATIQCLGLLQGGAPGIHFYTLNKSTATREILSALRMHARL